MTSRRCNVSCLNNSAGACLPLCLCLDVAEIYRRLNNAYCAYRLFVDRTDQRLLPPNDSPGNYPEDGRLAWDTPQMAAFDISFDSYALQNQAAGNRRHQNTRWDPAIPSKFISHVHVPLGGVSFCKHLVWLLKGRTGAAPIQYSGLVVSAVAISPTAGHKAGISGGTSRRVAGGLLMCNGCWCLKAKNNQQLACLIICKYYW